MGLAALSPAVILDTDPSDPPAARPTMLGAAASGAGGLAEDFVEPLFRMMGEAVSAAAGWAFAGAAELEFPAVLLARLVASAEAEGLALAVGTGASFFSESSLAVSVVDG